jgi:hypothetical protein
MRLARSDCRGERCSFGADNQVHPRSKAASRLVQGDLDEKKLLCRQRVAPRHDASTVEKARILWPLESTSREPQNILGLLNRFLTRLFGRFFNAP